MDPYLGISWIFWGSLCFLMAIIYYYVWPRPKANRQHPIREWIMRNAHSLVWIWLGLSCFSRLSLQAMMLNLPDVFALLGLTIYVVFLIALLSDRWAGRKD